MNAETQVGQTKLEEPEGASLLARGLEPLSAFCEASQPLRGALDALAKLEEDEIAKGARRLLRKLDGFEPSVTMIGQIKSGKTSLVNAMIGMPGMLPADVNPWTSVVTSLHLSPTVLVPRTSAKFRFFENGEWDRLISAGGRVGELANRAGADNELEKIKEQIAQMREKSKTRLGRKFEILLGQEHSYGYFDKDLIERYVCLGDDFTENETGSDNQGRYADITKSADLFMDQPAIPCRLCIRDTPGVNDTFMMREQITIQSIRDSRICVVVLSAHQALSSTDLALIRLISNIKSREVIIFVNRIDELSDPCAQVPEIRQSILDTLEVHKGPVDVQIIFGSALWANHALTGDLKSLPRSSAKALMDWARSGEHKFQKGLGPALVFWEVSGLPALYRAISARIVGGVGQEAIETLVTSAANLTTGLLAADKLAQRRRDLAGNPAMDAAVIGEEFAVLKSRNAARLETELETVLSDFSARIGRSHDSFLQRATEALIAHLEQFGESSVWQYDPTGLRVLFGASYRAYGLQVQKAYETAAKNSAVEIDALYRRILGVEEDLPEIQPPGAPHIPPPVSLGQTIALDIKGSWWKSWWLRRRGYQAHASSFFDLIKAETVTFVADLKEDQAQAIRDSARDRLDQFLDEQHAVLTGVIDPNAADNFPPDEARSQAIALIQNVLKGECDD